MPSICSDNEPSVFKTVPVMGVKFIDDFRLALTLVEAVKSRFDRRLTHGVYTADMSDVRPCPESLVLRFFFGPNGDLLCRVTEAGSKAWWILRNAGVVRRTLYAARPEGPENAATAAEHDRSSS